MKHHLAIIMILCFVALPLLFAETWKITSLNWEPYSASDMASQGMSIQKLRTLLKNEGIELVVEFYPWERAQQLAKSPDYVGYFPAWPEEVDEGFIASKAIDYSNIGIVVNTESVIIWEDLENLFNKYRVGVISSYVYPDDITTLIKKYSKNIDYCQDENQLMKKLSGKRFDAAITDPDVTIYLAKREGITNIKMLNSILIKKELVVAFRNGSDNSRRIELLNNLLKGK